MTTSMIPTIKGFHCGQNTSGEETELTICINVPDAITASSVVAHLIVLCAQYRVMGQVPVTVNTSNEAAPPADGTNEPSKPTSSAPVPVATKLKRTPARKAPTNKGGAVSPAEKAAAAIANVTAVPVVATPIAVVSPVTAKPEAAEDKVELPAYVPAALVEMTSFRQILLWLGTNIGQDFDELTTLVQKCRPYVPAIARTPEGTDADVYDRIKRGIGVLISNGALKAA